jgi:hypothetical protein
MNKMKLRQGISAVVLGLSAHIATHAAEVAYPTSVMRIDSRSSE